MTTEITVKDLEDDLVTQLDAIASENGQNLEGFVQSALTQIVNNHAARKQKGLATRIATRVRGIGLAEGETLAELPDDDIRNPFGDGP